LGRRPSDQVLRWHSDPVAADVLGGTIPMVIEGSTLRLPGGVGKELVLSATYRGIATAGMPNSTWRTGPDLTSRSLQRGCLNFGARVRGSVQRPDPAICSLSPTTTSRKSTQASPRPCCSASPRARLARGHRMADEVARCGRDPSCFRVRSCALECSAAYGRSCARLSY